MSKRIILLLLILTMFIWAANFYVVKIALLDYSAMPVAAFRFLFAAIVLYGVVAVKQKTLKIKCSFSLKEWIALFFTSFFGVYLTIYFFNKGLTTASPINSSLIIATTPIYTAIFTRFLLKGRLSLWQWISIFLSIFGVAFLLVKGDLVELFRLQISEGDSYIVLMSIVLSLSQIIVSKYLKHVDSILLTTITCLIALVLFVISCIPELTTVPMPTSFDFWASILFMGILGTGLGYTIFYLSIVELGATKTTLFMNLIPFFVVLIAIPLGEQLLISQLIGGLIIVFGLLIFNWQKQKNG